MFEMPFHHSTVSPLDRNYNCSNIQTPILIFVHVIQFPIIKRASNIASKNYDFCHAKIKALWFWTPSLFPYATNQFKRF
uniref:Uncharacterized protein n=1 Tax=Anguilla anguilla TaxID=7936 RepID=A0A0E9T7T5_ANGAN